MKTHLLAATALLALTALPANAQDASAGVSTDISASVSAELPSVETGTSVDASANASANAGGNSDNTYGSVVSSIAGSADIDLTTYTDETKVTIVLLSELQGNAANEASALDNALSTNAEAMTKLHTNVEANAVIKAKLEAGGHSVDDVVAVKTAADGSLIIYVDDRP
jgi:hypothetical protein